MDRQKCLCHSKDKSFKSPFSLSENKRSRTGAVTKLIKFHACCLRVVLQRLEGGASLGAEPGPAPVRQWAEQRAFLHP